MKALVCGAGIAGLAAAGRLRHHGWEVLVVDHAPGPRAQGYMIDFFGPGFEAVTAMGLLGPLREAASAVDRFRYVDTKGRTTVGMDYSLFTKALGGQIVSVMRPALERMLREALPGDVEVRYGITVDRIGSRDVVLSDGSTVAADLVVGADGIHSRVRRLVFAGEAGGSGDAGEADESGVLRYLGMHTGAYVFRDPAMHEEVRGQFVLTETLNRQIGFYGLGEEQVAVFAVHRTPDPALPEDLRGTLRRRYAGLGDLADRALELCPPDPEIYYDQVAQTRAPRWHDGRVVLIGDAAHAVSLVAGQGASLGVAGAYVLAERLSRADSVSAALAEYERAWRPVASRVQENARERAADWFVPTRTWKLLARRWGFRVMKVPGFDKILVDSVMPKAHRTVAELVA